MVTRRTHPVTAFGVAPRNRGADTLPRPHPSPNSNLNFTFRRRTPAQVLPRTPSAATPNDAHATRSSGAPRSSPESRPAQLSKVLCGALWCARSAARSRPARAKTVQSPARCARSAARSRPRARNGSPAACPVRAKRRTLAPERAPNSPAAFPEPKRAHKSWKARSRSANEMETYESRRNRCLLFQPRGGIATTNCAALRPKTSLAAITLPAPPTPNQQQEANDPTPASTTASAAHARRALRDHRA